MELINFIIEFVDYVNKVISKGNLVAGSAAIKHN